MAVPKTVFTWNYWLGEPEDVRTLLLVFASIGGSIIAIVGIRLSHLRSVAATKQSETSENIYLTDLMVKAAGQLSDKSAFVRSVGINALERISVQSEPDTVAAANVLAQFFQDILPEYTGKAIRADQHLSTNKLYARRGDASDAARVLSYISTLLADIDHSICLNRCYFPPSLIFCYGLTKFDFTDCFFKGHDFSSNRFSNCEFKKTVLDDCDFNVTWLEKCEFIDLSLSGVRFPSTAFIDCGWRNVYGYGTYFGRSTVANGMFFDSRFTDARFHFVDFNGSKFIKSHFVGCDFSGANLSDVEVLSDDATFVNCVYHKSNPPFVSDERWLQDETKFRAVE